MVILRLVKARKGRGRLIQFPHHAVFIECVDISKPILAPHLEFCLSKLDLSLLLWYKHENLAVILTGVPGYMVVGTN
jgi:hypothetical protein